MWTERRSDSRWDSDRIRRSCKAIVRMLESANDPLGTDPQLVASMLQGAMVGVSRRMLESGAAEKQFDSLCRELIFMACVYVDACSAGVSVRGAGLR